MNIQQQSEQFLTQLQNRKQSPARPATVRQYRSLLNAWILPAIGDLPLADCKNSTLKTLVQTVHSAGKSAATVQAVLGLTKQIVASALDSEGEQLYPRHWNGSFIDAPEISDQNAPVIGRQALQGLLGRTQGEQMALYMFLAATGLRIGEALALRADRTDTGSWWDRKNCIAHVRSTLSHGKVQMAPKTDAGIRQVDLAADINAVLSSLLTRDSGLLFQNKLGGPVRLQTEYDRLRRLGVPEGFHAFRRFRVTHLESSGVPRSLVQFWTGHAGQDVTDRYVRLESNLPVRREWCEKAGAGFEVKS